MPGLQKVSKNKAVGQQYVWEQDLLIIQINFVIKAVKDKKMPE
jgi:hypothetical protein